MANETSEFLDKFGVGFRLGVAARMGHIIVGSSHLGALHYVDLSPEGDAILYNYAISSPVYNVASVINGLHMSGLQRRQGLHRQFIEAGPQDIQRGDKLVLEEPDSGPIVTRGINRFLSNKILGEVSH